MDFSPDLFFILCFQEKGGGRCEKGEQEVRESNPRSTPSYKYFFAHCN